MPPHTLSVIERSAGGQAPGRGRAPARRARRHPGLHRLPTRGLAADLEQQPASDPAAGDELVVVTHRPLPEAWLAGHPDAPFHTAGSVEAGIALAKKSPTVSSA